MRVVVPFAAGGPTDFVARLVVNKLSERWHQKIYIENVLGASGNIATRQVARAAPDGYTVLITTSGFVVNPILYAPKPYDAVTDFAPITVAAEAPNVLIVHPSVPAHSVQELIDLVKANPGKYSFASAGVGQTGHLGGEFLNHKFGLDLAHVPFNGGGPVMNAIVAGHTQIAFLSLPSAASYIRDGSVRGLMVTSAQRSKIVPDVPSCVEVGLADEETSFFQGILAPANTPREVIDKWQRDVADIVQQPDVRERLEGASFTVKPITSEQFGEMIKREDEHWARVIDELKIQKVQ
ncbi:MAG: tripartite tricarboxylate transporter substrate binding protein [Bradyrhizobium sp.]